MTTDLQRLLFNKASFHVVFLIFIIADQTLGEAHCPLPLCQVRCSIILHKAPSSSSHEMPQTVSLIRQFGLAVKHYAGKQKGLSSIPLQLSFLVRKVVVCGCYLVTRSFTINEILKWLSLLPILMQESFWWRQCTLPPFSLFPISLKVSVDVKHHVYFILPS